MAIFRIASESVHGSRSQSRARQLAQVPSQHLHRGRLSHKRGPSCRASSPSQQLDKLQVPQTGIAKRPALRRTAAPVHPDALRRRQEAEARAAKRQSQTAAMRTGKGWWELGNQPNQHLVQSPAEFQQRLRLAKEADQLVLVLCFAPWCAACKALHPKVQQLAERNPTVTFLEVNAGDAALHKMCEEDLGIPKLPYVHIVKGKQGLISDFAVNLTPAKMQKLRAAIMVHKGQSAPLNS